MKTTYSLLAATALALGPVLAGAQDNQKPAPSGPPPAPDAARPADPNAPPPPGAPTPPPPGPDGRHGDHRGSRTPEAGRHGDMPNHAEGERRTEGWHHSWQLPPPPPPKPTAYIGVITTPPPAVLSAQLGLAEGFGLVVGDVLPDSPAAKAGIQRYDVLTKFNDQQLVDSSQFSTLVRALKKDTDASVTLIRKAQEQKITVKIDELDFCPNAVRFRAQEIFPGEYRRLQGDSESAGGKAQEYAGRVRGYGDRMREFQERMKAWQKNPSAEIPKMPELPAADPGSPISPEDILREVRPGGVARIHLLQPDGAVTYNMANARLLMKDESGEIELTTHDGKRSLVARNIQGETIFDGPIDTEEQRKSLPEDVRKKMEMIEVQRKLAQAPAPGPGEPVPPDVQ